MYTYWLQHQMITVLRHTQYRHTHFNCYVHLLRHEMMMSPPWTSVLRLDTHTHTVHYLFVLQTLNDDVWWWKLAMTRLAIHHGVHLPQNPLGTTPSQWRPSQWQSQWRQWPLIYQHNPFHTDEVQNHHHKNRADDLVIHLHTPHTYNYNIIIYINRSNRWISSTLKMATLT